MRDEHIPTIMDPLSKSTLTENKFLAPESKAQPELRASMVLISLNITIDAVLFSGLGDITDILM